ncbi:hypothetical protein K435DRAFT_795351 [Dendrothele bispora CBS 962.96]|uniref:Uncharacterized protein n=1 Tax=Dendrothele bispora (strain CBS 962.96) TaxID=1314807 RepID=A0A4S8M8Y6_DENBC|nr:hypothetical protein K435DRAFT_795351 [Dendrothele bispora CBS 962.96]
MSDESLQSVLTSDDAFGVETIIVTESIEGLLYGLEFFLTFCTGYLLSIFASNIVFGVVQIKGLVGDSNYDPTPTMAITPIVVCVFLLSLLGVVGVLNYIVDNYVSTVLPHAETIYPNIIILLTTLQKTHWDTTLQGSCQIPSMSMCFALAPIRSETRDLNRSVPVGFGQSHVIPTTINHHEPGVGPSSSSVSLKEDQSHQVEQEYKHREEVAVAVRRIQSTVQPPTAGNLVHLNQN